MSGLRIGGVLLALASTLIGCNKNQSHDKTAGTGEQYLVLREPELPLRIDEYFIANPPPERIRRMIVDIEIRQTNSEGNVLGWTEEDTKLFKILHTIPDEGNDKKMRLIIETHASLKEVRDEILNSKNVEKVEEVRYPYEDTYH